MHKDSLTLLSGMQSYSVYYVILFIREKYALDSSRKVLLA